MVTTPVSGSQLHAVYPSPNRVGPDAARIVTAIVHAGPKTNLVIKAGHGGITV